jgi:rhamnogalacturonan acetylesterase
MNTTTSNRRIQNAARPGMRFERLCLALAILASCVSGCASTAPSTESKLPAAAAPTPAPDSARPLPTLFLAGDSTVHNTSPGLTGWGDVIAPHFDGARIRVDNRARAGRSSRTFQTEGLWNQLLAAAKPGDFVLIQFGHNDSGPLDDTNRARGTIKGLGDESREIYNPITRQQEIVHTYGWYLRRCVGDARARGITPILCSPVPRMPRQPPQASDVDSYVAWSTELAAQEKVDFIDLNRLIRSHYAGLGTNEIKTTYFTARDNTHSSLAGAQLNAACVVEGLRSLPNCPLGAYLLQTPAPPAPR